MYKTLTELEQDLDTSIDEINTKLVEQNRISKLLGYKNYKNMREILNILEVEISVSYTMPILDGRTQITFFARSSIGKALGYNSTVELLKVLENLSLNYYVTNRSIQISLKG